MNTIPYNNDYMSVFFDILRFDIDAWTVGQMQLLDPLDFDCLSMIAGAHPACLDPAYNWRGLNEDVFAMFCHEMNLLLEERIK